MCMRREQYRLSPSRCIFRADAHVKSGRVILPLIVRRICRYDCGGKQGEIGTSKGRGAFSQLAWTTRGPGHVPYSNTVNPQIRFCSAYCFSFTQAFSPLTLPAHLPCFHPSFFSCRVHPKSTDVTEGHARLDGPVNAS